MTTAATDCKNRKPWKIVGKLSESHFPRILQKWSKNGPKMVRRWSLVIKDAKQMIKKLSRGPQRPFLDNFLIKYGVGLRPTHPKGVAAFGRRALWVSYLIKKWSTNCLWGPLDNFLTIFMTRDHLRTIFGQFLHNFWRILGKWQSDNFSTIFHGFLFLQSVTAVIIAILVDPSEPY